MLTKAFLLFWGFMSGQCVTNGTLNSTCSGNGYNNGCVNGWNASHGDPTVMGTVGSNTWVWMWSHSNKGEGIVTNYNFESGRTYQISFRIKASTNVTNPTTAVQNATLNVQATSALPATSGYIIPSSANAQSIWTSTVANAGTSWQTITVNYTPTSNFSQLWFYPLMTANSTSNGSAQIQMEIDDVVVTPPVTSVFHFQNASGAQKTDFCDGEAIFLNGTASFGENQYYIDVWRRPIGSTAAFQWQTQLGQNGWTIGQAGILNLTSLFSTQNYTFATGYEYQIKLATASTPCVGWVETSHTFRVLNNTTASPAFTFTTFCAANGTISVTATATNTSSGINQWWGLMETNAAGATSDASTIGQIGGIQSGNTVTFTGLSRTRHYYIKHGVYGNCINWSEQRTALPQSVSWANYTTNFNLAPSSALNGTVTVTAVALPNPVAVSHHWSIFYAPNGVTTGNTNAPNNPDQCCANATATFSANLIVNEWYYIKHGIWNDCSDWNETRKAFRVVIQGLLPNGNPDYAIETAAAETVSTLKQVSPALQKEENLLYPNPVSAAESLHFSTNISEVIEAILIDFIGNTHKLPLTKVDTKTVEIPLNNMYKPGIYSLKVTRKDQSIITQKIVVK